MGRKEDPLYAKSIIDAILLIKPDLAKNREKFSDYVINRIVGDFINDPSITGEFAEKKKKAKDIYIRLMNEWEKQFEELTNDTNKQN